MGRTRYTVENIENNRFYQLPKFLFEGEFENLSNDARVLYALLKDRHELSLKNNWVNDNGEVYLIYSREDMAKMLKVSQPTLRKIITQLKDVLLIEEERMGLNKPNRIYLTIITHIDKGVKKDYIPDCKKISFQNEENLHSKVKENYIQNCNEFSPNDTNINKTEDNDTEYQSVSHIKKIKNKKQTDRQTDTKYNSDYDFTEIEEYFKDKIEYSSLEIIYKRNIYLVNEILYNIMDMFFNDITYINGQPKNKDIIRGVISKIDFNHIEEIIIKIEKYDEEIKNKKAYMQTLIYNTILEMQIGITNSLKYNGIY